MVNPPKSDPLVELIDDSLQLSLADLSAACELPDSLLIEMTEFGLLNPDGSAPNAWRFSAVQISRARRAGRLHHSLGLNVAGAALAVELLEEIDRLRARLQRYEIQENNDE